MRQIAAGQGELATGHHDGALVEIGPQQAIHRVFDHAEGAHEIGQRDISKAGFLLRLGDALVDVDRVILGDEADKAQDFGQRVARRSSGQNHVGDGNGAGVDERVARSPILQLQLDDGIERIAGGLASDPPPQPVTDHAERQGQGEDLGNALDGEGRVAIARR